MEESMPLLSQKRYAVFVRRESEGSETFTREPYNIVESDFGNGDQRTMIEPTCGRPLSPLERAEVYDEVRFYDRPPFPGTRIGYATSATPGA
jgi:hypothetical protein